MPSRVGRVKKIYEDGHVRVIEDTSKQEFFGSLVIGSGGMVMFSPEDERPVTVGTEGVRDKKKESVEVKA
jgi:hypothetical protein